MVRSAVIRARFTKIVSDWSHFQIPTSDNKFSRAKQTNLARQSKFIESAVASCLGNWPGRQKINVIEKENKILITSTRGRFSQFDLFIFFRFISCFHIVLFPPLFLYITSFLLAYLVFYIWFCLTILETIHCLPIICVVFCLHSSVVTTTDEKTRKFLPRAVYLFSVIASVAITRENKSDW